MPLCATVACFSLSLSYAHSARAALSGLPLYSHYLLPSKPSSSLSTPRSSSLLHSVSHPAFPPPELAEGGPLTSSAAAVAVFIRRASPASPVGFTQKAERIGKNGLILPSPEFRRLCLEQLHLFRAVVDKDAVLSVYVRPAGSYVMDQIELRRITCYPGVEVLEVEECLVLFGNFAIPGSLHAAEIAISNQEAEIVAEYGAIVFPMVKHPFVVGFIVAELPEVNSANHGNDHSHKLLSFKRSKNDNSLLPPSSQTEAWETPRLRDEFGGSYGTTTSEERLRAAMISRSLATAYVMDQKAMLLQQTFWQNNNRMSHLVEQICGSLSCIRALSKMLSTHVKRSEIAYDIVEDVLVQGEKMKDTIQQLQDAVHITKANIMQYNEECLKKMQGYGNDYKEFSTTLLSTTLSRKASKEDVEGMPQGSRKKDIEVPMPPLLLAPLQEHSIRTCNASEVLKDLVGAAATIASKQQRSLELNELDHPLPVAVEESHLRQALSNLIEGSLLRTRAGGKVEIHGVRAPAGGALVLIDDNGPDMHYMTQMHSLTPFGADLFSGSKVEDNMTWNFIAGLAVAREILESYGCVVRVVSPRKLDAALGAGGTRIELWLPMANFSGD